MKDKAEQLLQILNERYSTRWHMAKCGECYVVCTTYKELKRGDQIGLIEVYPDLYDAYTDRYSTHGNYKPFTADSLDALLNILDDAFGTKYTEQLSLF